MKDFEVLCLIFEMHAKYQSWQMYVKTYEMWAFFFFNVCIKRTLLFLGWGTSDRSAGKSYSNTRYFSRFYENYYDGKFYLKFLNKFIAYAHNKIDPELTNA